MLFSGFFAIVYMLVREREKEMAQRTTYEVHDTSNGHVYYCLNKDDLFFNFVEQKVRFNVQMSKCKLIRIVDNGSTYREYPVEFSDFDKGYIKTKCKELIKFNDLKTNNRNSIFFEINGMKFYL